MLRRNEDWYTVLLKLLPVPDAVKLPGADGKKFASCCRRSKHNAFQCLSLDDGQGPVIWKPLMAKLWYTNSVERIRP